MIHTTLGYIEHQGSYLMLLRNKKKNDLNEGKWIGVGGHIEEGETPDACFIREVKEETGLTLSECECRGVIDFLSDTWEDERMYLYYGKSDTSEVSDCSEGTLAWVPAEEIFDLNLWEGDRVFLRPFLAGEKEIRIQLRYEGERLAEVTDLR